MGTVPRKGGKIPISTLTICIDIGVANAGLKVPIRLFLSKFGRLGRPPCSPRRSTTMPPLWTGLLLAVPT